MDVSVGEIGRSYAVGWGTLALIVAMLAWLMSLAFQRLEHDGETGPLRE